MIEFDDIQYLVMTRVPALTGRYEFLSFRQPAQGRAWLAGVLDKVASIPTGQGINRTRAKMGVSCLHVARTSRDRSGRAIARNLPRRIPPGHGGARGGAWRYRQEPFRSVAWRPCPPGPARHRNSFCAQCGGARACNPGTPGVLGRTPAVEALSSLDLDGFPPFDYAHEHFGYRDRLSEPQIEGSGIQPTPGSGAPVKAGEFILGQVDESGELVPLPKPEVLSRNGTFMAYRRLQEHVGAFRDFLRQHGGPTAEGQELIAAKLMGRWRSGAPLVLAPEKDDPALGADYQRNNNFNYAQMDPQGYAVPLGSHIRRMNPRDTTPNIQRRRMIRRGATYGPPLPEGAPEDGVDRGIAAFILCASLVRQFEFAQNVWINDPNFHELGNERDPLIGNQDGTFDFTIPKRPIRKKITGLPAFTTSRAALIFFFPELRH